MPDTSSRCKSWRSSNESRGLFEERRKPLSWRFRSEKLCKLRQRLRKRGCYLIKTVKTFGIAKHIDAKLAGNVKSLSSVAQTWQFHLKIFTGQGRQRNVSKVQMLNGFDAADMPCRRDKTCRVIKKRILKAQFVSRSPSALMAFYIFYVPAMSDATMKFEMSRRYIAKYNATCDREKKEKKKEKKRGTVLFLSILESTRSLFYENSRETRGWKHKGIFHALFRLGALPGWKK